MMSKAQRVLSVITGTVLAAATAQAGGPVAERPQIHGWRVPDNSLTVDGQRADWERAGVAFTRGGVGASDCSYTVWAAHDPHHYGRTEAKAALERIMKRTNR